MSKLQFTKATKEQARLRLALFGPSGAGKTYTALKIATGMGGSIAVIDTERGSASKYADRFEFDVLELDARNIATYCQAIEAANRAGYNVLIIDSLTHAWQELLADVNKIARARYSGNTWAAWSEGTPKQMRFIDMLLNSDCHTIATMRSKTEWLIQEDEKGRKRPERVGLNPMQGKGIEYEFDMLMEISPEHTAVVLKDRTGKYQDEMIELPDEKFGQSLAEWLKEGVSTKQKRQKEQELTHDELLAAYSANYHAAVVRKMTIEPLDTKTATPAEIVAATLLLEGYLETERPYAPGKVIRGLRLKAGWEHDKGSGVWARQPDDEQEPPISGDFQRAAALLESALETDQGDDTEALRHEVVGCIFGRESLKDLTKLEVHALLAWAEREPGAWEINPFVSTEALSILSNAPQEEK